MSARSLTIGMPWKSPRLLLVTLLACGGVIGCAESDPPSTEELFQQQMDLPAVYLTSVTGTRIIAPSRDNPFVDPKTGEVAWLAMSCENPDCPGRTAEEPFLFIAPNMGVRISADGTFTSDPRQGKPFAVAPPNAPFLITPFGCPQCMTLRKVGSESAAQKQKYNAWVRPYVLPETAKKMKELDELRAKRLKMEREDN